MISTRYLAGTIAVSLLSLPFIAPSPASAAAGEVTTAATLYTGATATITLVDGDETGAYAVELWKTAKVATIKTGADITAAGTSLKWTIPTTSATLVGTAFKIKIVSTATVAEFTAIESAEFDIAKSSAVVASQSDLDQGQGRTINWTRNGESGGTVDISLVPATGKAVLLADNTDNDGSENVTIPIKTLVTTGYKIRVTPSNLAALGSDSAAFAVTAPDIYVAPDDSSVYIGQKVPVYAETTYGNVQLDLVLKSAPTKSVLKIAKEATYEQMNDDLVTFTPSPKLAPGTYQILATVVGSKPAVTSLSGDITISGLPALSLHADTIAALADGVVQGQSVKIRFTSDSYASKSGVTVSLVKGSAKAVTLDAKEVIVNGDGSYTWAAPAALAVGTDYKVVVHYNDLKTGATNFDVKSDAFTVVANSTVLVAP